MALSVNPASNVRRPKLPKYSTRLGLNLATAPPVIKAAERLEAEHRGLVALCLFAGLRVSEALSVKAENIRDEAGHKVLEVVSKGGRSDLVPLSPPAMRLLSDLLNSHPVGLLFPGVDRFKASRMVAALGKEAGLDRPLTPHDLRHGMVTCSLEAGEPLHRVQQLARHASPVTTQRYDHSRDRLDSSAAYGLARALGDLS
jgi:integrase